MSKFGEGEFRQKTTELLRKLGLKVSCVEGAGMGGTPGIPDVHYAGKASLFSEDRQSARDVFVEGWIELKVLRHEDIAKSALTSAAPVVTGLAHFTSKQRVWLTEYAHLGGRCHVYLRSDWGDGVRRYHLFDGRHASAHLGKDLLLRDFTSWSLFDHNYPTVKMPDASHLLRALLRSRPQKMPIP